MEYYTSCLAVNLSQQFEHGFKMDRKNRVLIYLFIFIIAMGWIFP